MLKKRLTLLRPLPILIVILAFGCGGKAPVYSGASSVQRPAMENQYPVLQWVPAGADVVIVSGRTQDGFAAMEQFIPTLQEWGAVLPNISDLNAIVGGRIDRASTWQNIGVDVDAAVTIFGVDKSVTLVLPVIDATLALAFQGELSPSNVRSHHNYEVVSTNSDFGFLSVLNLEGAMVFHWDVSDDSEFVWLEEMLSASTGMAYGSGSEAQSALAQATKSGQSPAFWGSAAGLIRKLSNNQWILCAGLLGHVRGISFSGEMGANPDSPSLAFRVTAELDSGTVSSLGTVLSLGPSEGMQSLRSEMGFFASVGIDLQESAKALRNAQCPQIAQLIGDPLSSVGWSPPPNAIHLAGSKINLSDFSGDIALEIAMKASKFIKNQLGKIPGRSWMESTKTMAGEKVTKLSVPTMSSIFYQLNETFFRFANQKNTMSQMIESNPGERGEIFAIGIQPRRIPQLRDLLELVLPGMAGFWESRLQKIDHLQLKLVLDGNSLVMTGSLATVR